MELNIEHSGEIGAGKYPDFLQFHDTVGQQFFVKSGEIFGKASLKIDNGRFDDVTWLEENNVSPDKDVSLLEIKTLSGFGVVGSYLTPTAQKMIIYEYQQDMSTYLNSGKISFNADTPIASFTLSLENPIDEETEIEGSVAINEESSLLSPGAKVIFKFTVGDEIEEVDLGSYYIDRSLYDKLSETASADGRNLIGKALKDQTLNENSKTGYNNITTIINNMLANANLGVDQYEVEFEAEKRIFEFDPNKEILSGLEEIFKAMVNWKMEETHEGEIIVGSPTFELFPQRGIYTFYRDKEIFSRQVNRDDQGSYRKVCVHDSDWNIEVYEDVSVYTGWSLQSNKTLFVQVADGTRLSNAQAIAVNVSNRLANVGKIESFVGPFRPQLLIGDEARIVDADGSTSLGLITQISHEFGKGGFYTSFTVDSGGKLGRGRLSDYINMIKTVGTAGSIAYEDIVPEPEPPAEGEG